MTGLLAICVALTIWAQPVLNFAQATADQVLEPQTYVRAVLGPDGGGETP